MNNLYKNKLHNNVITFSTGGCLKTFWNSLYVANDTSFSNPQFLQQEEAGGGGVVE